MRIFLKKLGSSFGGLIAAVFLNLAMLTSKIQGKKTIVLHISKSTQFIHIESVLRKLVNSDLGELLSLHILTNASDISVVATMAEAVSPDLSVHTDYSARFLIFCDFMLTVEQGTTFPYFGCRGRACMFHGQPSKGNVYQRFNFRQINTLFFYGPMMRDHYLRNKENNPAWPDVLWTEVGQPLSDNLVVRQHDKVGARNLLGLNAGRFTVIYAPSFEYCSSFATHGSEIIEMLLSIGINLIVKPHPAFYNIGQFGDQFNREIPNIEHWAERAGAYNSLSNCIFPDDGTLETSVALAAADMMLTDFSGIAFDGILMDLGMTYWECPLFYSEYLPQRYGVDEETSKSELACNVGRDAGVIVNNTSELAAAITVYRNNPKHMARERRAVRRQLLFNPGEATNAMAKTIVEMLGADS